MNVLFIGNSAVYYKPEGIASYAVPEILQTLANLGGKDFSYTGTYIGGGTLEDHWNDDYRINATDEINSGAYDVVIMNGRGEDNFETYADLFANLIHDNGGQSIFYGLWANDFEISISGGDPAGNASHLEYLGVAEGNDSGYVPNGKAFQAAHAALTQLYGNGDDGETAEDILTADTSHPTKYMTYLVANLLYYSLFGTTPPSPSTFRPAGMSLSDAQLLQGIARDAVLGYGITLDEIGGGGSTPTTGTITGQYFYDADGDGIQDSGETGVIGATVQLMKGTTVIATTTTAAHGVYSFDSVPADSYKIKFATPPSGYEFTAANVGSNEAVDSDVISLSGTAGLTGTINLVAGSTVTNVDAGVKLIATGGGGSDPDILVFNPADYDQTVTGTGAGEPLLGSGRTDDYITGLGGSDEMRGYGGDDYFDGGSGADASYGGSGADVFVFDAADTLDNGGSGVDRVIFRDGASGPAPGLRFASIEIYDFVNGIDDDFTFTYAQMRAGRDAELRITGEAGDIVRVDTTKDAVLLGSVVEDGQTYLRYQIGSAIFGIDDDIDFYVDGVLV